MEKRKARISAHFDDILEETNTLKNNLNKVINHVFSCVEKVKKAPEEIKQKDISVIISYELDVLKKLTEFNYELENIIDQSPLEPLKVTEKEYEVDSNMTESNEILAVSTYDNSADTRTSRSSVESPVDSVLNTAACSSLYISELISNNCNGEISSSFSDNDIQKVLRESLQKFSEKLGLNEQSISSMKDYYLKPSVSGVETCSLPSSSQNPPECSISYKSVQNPEIDIRNEFVFPEKDTNNVTQCESVVVENLPLKMLNSDVPKTVNSSEDTRTLEPVFQNGVYCPDVSSLSSDAEMVMSKSDDDSLTNENITKPTVHCQKEDNCPLQNAKDQHCKTESSNSEPKKIVYTALEKLNNATFLRKKEETVEISNKPNLAKLLDLKLIPSEAPVIKNNLEVKNKLRKKKNKKGKSDKDEQVYEINCKPAPTAGVECAFSHVENPGEFYIHIVDEESALIDTLNEIINETFHDTTSEYNSKEEASANVGFYGFAYVAFFNGWYRVKILNWQLEIKSDNVLVQMVDYGNKRHVSYKNIRRMTKEMSEYPMLAVRCHLPLMYPPQSTYFHRLTEWPSETIDALVELSGMFQPENLGNKFFKLAYVAQEGESVAIDLYKVNEEDPEHTVGQILLDLGLAVQILEEPDEENLEVEEFLQDIDNLERADNINEAVIGYDPRDEARICRFTKPDGSCFKGKNCKLEHIPLSKDGFTTDKEPVFKEAMDTLLLPATGEVTVLLITGYKDACNYFAQIVRVPHREKSVSREYVIDSELYSLLGTMNNAKVVKTFETFKLSPAIGEVVVAKHKLSKKWLRAVVRERIVWNNDDSEEYQVFMVDFGDNMQLPLSELRKIKPEFLQLPFQVVECYIHNYRAKRDCDKKKVEHFFYKNLLFHNFVAVAMSSSLPLKVGIKTFNGNDISKTLVKEGFAEERTYDTNPANGCPIELY